MMFSRRYLHSILKLSRSRLLSTNVEQYPESLEPKFVGCDTCFTTDLSITDCSSQKPVPTYRILDSNGKPLCNLPDSVMNQKFVTDMYKCMITVNEIDKILFESQRQGRISFYMTSHGEEGVQVGSSAALSHEDLIYGQYRELGALLWRGFTTEQVMNQCYGNEEDWGKGKQMPVHYGSRIHNFVTISSPLGTQIPQAVGSAYAYKLAKNGQCVLVYFGEGAASEGDAHAAFNFASTLDCPVIFFCRNNGYAISTPAWEQYRGDGIAGRAAGYGIATVRVDGNDTLAVFLATVFARKYAVEHNRPIILEALTYRRGHHSTSDDSTAYRSPEEIKSWNDHDPIRRLCLFIKALSWWSDDEDNSYRKSVRKDLLAAFSRAEKKKKPEWQEMFYDVYYEMPDHLMNQMKYMEDHLKKYGNCYSIDNFKSENKS